MIYSIQSLRGIAALLVVIVHAEDLINRYFVGSRLLHSDQFFNDARCGVDLFFVISGFVMTYISYARQVSWGSFIVGRIIRIVPLYWFFTILLAVLILLLPSLTPNLTFSVDRLVRSLFFIPSQESPLVGIGWTLNYEMFFYFIFAFALISPGRGGLFYVLSVLFLLVGVGQFFQSNNPVLNHVTSPLLLEFVSGSILGWIWIRNRLESYFGYIFILLGIILIVVPIDGHRALDWGVGCFFVVLGSLMVPSNTFLHTNIPLTRLGMYSYSLYLSHDFVLPVVGKIWVKFGLNNMLPSFFMAVVAIAASICVAILTFYLIERKLDYYCKNFLKMGVRVKPT